MSTSDVNRYDRQIRAWGFETQRRLQASKIFVKGINWTSIECMKNLILAGVGKIVIFDESNKQNTDLQVLSTLNPNTQMEFTYQPEITNYDVICLFDSDEDTIEEAIKSDKVVIVCFGVAAYLVYQQRDFHFNTESEKTDNLGYTICGGLISQMIVDHLPPLTTPVALKLDYSPSNYSAKIVSVAEASN
ncbi:hypothetical protein TVAG_341340 [Trichomonas vaginalis G3]|uniref:THIF-type NAD/FAD binding fold domain-containing protein n=1 Tax=Trichomonas vaginalis (strain ATCC PRA-98 / G3) TaxID=412133 RepID=A2DTU3_TRIV3|nr:SUMO activating enzyme protein [Trichomonas vaginalis G3]EAY16240.1 hypothetical protein TVAG_341340 [Trichomonas vaginalis G3]KAI5493255.1 SUMO activating enzyme protein [Trichomonas vaginalis G3]|eukprot:XP_001328463.1 hypothetical protein [Trichomonas vaginalis G3]